MAFPPADAPLDDVAIHLRCGDTLAQAHGSYGVLPVAAIAAFVPADAPVRVGILSEAYRPVCDGELAGVVETRSAHSASKCPCPCAALVEDLVSALQRARPLAVVSVHDNELVMASWYRLAHAPHASLCMSSTFCLWPILGADHGYLVAGQLFPHGDELADKLPGLGVVKAEPYTETPPAGMKKVLACAVPTPVTCTSIAWKVASFSSWLIRSQRTYCTRMLPSRRTRSISSAPSSPSSSIAAVRTHSHTSQPQK